MKIETLNKIMEFVDTEKLFGDEYLTRLEIAYDEYIEDKDLDECWWIDKNITELCKAYTGKDTNIMFNLYLHAYECKNYGFEDEAREVFLEYYKRTSKALESLSIETSIKDYKLLTDIILEILEA